MRPLSINRKPLNISIQGQLGSFSHIAAEQLFGEGIELLQRDTFKEVFEDLAQSRCEYIVIPIENSTYGSVFQNYDLITEYNFSIIKEIYLKINFHLIGFGEAKLKDIEEVHTHPVGLAQIQKFLEEHPNITAVEFPDTAGSVKMIKEKFGKDYKNRRKHAAAASKLAAQIYDMDIIKDNIQENKNNYTRFFCLTKSNFNYLKIEEDENYKTSIQFQLGEESGSLFRCLKCFAMRGISLVKIESRPIINTHWQFTFYIDVKAGTHETRMKEALKDLKDEVENYRVIGTYKKGEYIET